MDAAIKLSLYNEALLVIGERFLSSLSEEREPRRLLDQVWAQGALDFCLEQAQWHFAMRTVEVDYDQSMEPAFGYARAFQKPVDWVITSALCSDMYFRSPITRATDEAGYWYTDVDTIYVKYVSKDTNYGYNLGQWPTSFRSFVAAYLASRIINRMSNSQVEAETVREILKHALKTAKNKAAMAEATSFSAQGAWSRSRNRFPNRRDGGGSSGNLIG